MIEKQAEVMRDFFACDCKSFSRWTGVSPLSDTPGNLDWSVFYLRQFNPMYLHNVYVHRN